MTAAIAKTVLNVQTLVISAIDVANRGQLIGQGFARL
jgi:hypothetical protein